MSDRSDTQREHEDQQEQDSQQEQDGRPERSSQEPDVQGVNLNPDSDNKSIEVDTHERLESKAEAPDFDELPEEELEKERQERLDPENRPDTAEVDNSQRTFNPETGLFEDSDVEPPEGAPFSTTEGEAVDSGAKDSEDSGDSEDSDDMDPMDAADDDAGDPKDRTEATDAEQSKEAKESKDTER